MHEMPNVKYETITFIVEGKAKLDMTCVAWRKYTCMNMYIFCKCIRAVLRKNISLSFLLYLHVIHGTIVAQISKVLVLLARLSCTLGGFLIVFLSTSF